MKYIIMADGNGTRWNNYKGIPKHLIRINGETLLERLVGQLKKYDKESEVVITSHDKRYEVKGATRYEPLNNHLEIDRFTYELIDDGVCFLYGDTYYSSKAIKTIINTSTDKVLFFGTKESIIAIKVEQKDVFKKHIDRVKKLFLEGKIKDCKGWHVYQSYENLDFDVKKIAGNYILISDNSRDYNTPADYKQNRVR